MPIKIPDSLPATAVLESENIFVMTEYRAMHQDIRPLNVLILNLMPTKVITENQLLRKLSNTPLQIKVEFLQTASYTPQHVDTEHMESFYTTFEQVKDRWFDGLIITGAPLAFVPYEEVHYWKELCKIMEWAKTHVHSTMHICWGALAGLYYHYGIPTVEYPEKLSGVYTQKALDKRVPLLRSFDDYFKCPHSRYTEVWEEDILKHPELRILAKSDEAGVFLVMNQDGSQIFVQGHPEYDRMTLNNEYHRDLNKGLNPALPVHYYEHDDPFSVPPLMWRNMANTLYTNWLNYYVYQVTPYTLEEDTE